MVKFLNNMSIGVRMLLSVALFLATLLYSMYSAYISIGANVDFAVQEMKGDEYQRPLASLLDATATMRALLTQARAGRSVESSLNDEVAVIERNMDALKKVQDEIGADLQFTDDGLKSRGRENLKFEAVQGKWTKLKQDIINDKTADLDEAVASFVADIRGMISHSGDTSNLILDPDLDSYYLMDVTLLALPQTLDRLSMISSTVYPWLASPGPLTDDQRTEAAVLARMLDEADIARVTGDMDTSLKEDPNFYGVNAEYQSVGPKLTDDYSVKNKALSAMLGQIAKGEKVVPAVFAGTVLAAQRSAYEFLSKGYKQLDHLLQTRIDSYQAQQRQSIMISLAGILISCLFFFVVTRTITLPLTELTQTMAKLMSGNLKAKVDYTDSRSEIGLIAKSIQNYKENSEKIVALQIEQKKRDEASVQEKVAFIDKLTTGLKSSVGQIAETVASASTELNGSASSLSDMSRDTSEKAATVAEISEQTSVSIQVVASSAEELTASIREISGQVEESSELIRQAVGQIHATDKTVKGLADSSSKIGEVVQLISEIAGQTNLLALNATIEAARAGEMGKGFAVVASEVKNLANQTAKATEEISANITSMQNETVAAVDAINGIGRIIEQVSTVSSGIASAVTQQASATQEIARNIQEVSSRTKEVTGNVQAVTREAEEAKGGADDVQMAATDLSRQAIKLREEVDVFAAQMKTL